MIGGIVFMVVLVQSLYIIYTIQMEFLGTILWGRYFFLSQAYNGFYVIGTKVVLDFLLPFLILIVSNVAIIKQLAASQRFVTLIMLCCAVFCFAVSQRFVLVSKLDNRIAQLVGRQERSCR